jgi:hypothetical protein
LSEWITDMEDEGTTFFEILGTTLPLTQCHLPGDLNPKCTTVRTSNVTGSGLHLVVCCRVDQAGSTGRHDSRTRHTACPTKLLQYILSTLSGSVTVFCCFLSSHTFPSHTVPATAIHCQHHTFTPQCLQH